jgi:hypothetical protein
LLLGLLLGLLLVIEILLLNILVGH